MDMAKDDFNQLILQTLSRLEAKQDKQTEELAKIKDQTTKTNGRVTALEKLVENLVNTVSNLKKRISRVKIKGGAWYEDKALVTAIATIVGAIAVVILNIFGIVKLGV